MTFPTAFTVQTRTVKEGPERDARGNLIRSWLPPMPQAVIGWGPPQTPDGGGPKVVGHDRVVVELEVYTPPEFVAGPRDRVIVPGKGEFLVIGYPEDMCNGPWGFRPGQVVNLHRAEG